MRIGWIIALLAAAACSSGSSGAKVVTTAVHPNLPEEEQVAYPGGEPVAISGPPMAPVAAPDDGADAVDE